MRFGDGKDRRFSRALALVVVALAAYLAAFVAVRASSSREECGIERVDLSEMTRTAFRPFVNLDKQLNQRVVYTSEEDPYRIAKHYFCGE